jgi:hypothetical protein
MRAQFTPSKKLWLLISPAPRREPNLFMGFFTRRPLIKSFADSGTRLAVAFEAGNSNGCDTTLVKVSSLSTPLNGVLEYRSSYRKIPNVHQSTELPWPSPNQENKTPNIAKIGNQICTREKGVHAQDFFKKQAQNYPYLNLCKILWESMRDLNSMCDCVQLKQKGLRVEDSWVERRSTPEMISGARYSCVPTNDMDRTSVGSTTSSGRRVVVVVVVVPPPPPLGETPFSWTGDEKEGFLRIAEWRNL